MDEGVVCCSESHQRYFNRNFEHNGFFRIISPPRIYLIGGKPYEPIDKNKILNEINEMLKEYEVQSINLLDFKKAIKEIYGTKENETRKTINK